MNSGAGYARSAGEVATKSLKNDANTKNSNDSTPALLPRITASVSGTIIAPDPDIPPNRQRVSFSAEGKGLRWLVSG